jgi:hypothetical protein
LLFVIFHTKFSVNGIILTKAALGGGNFIKGSQGLKPYLGLKAMFNHLAPVLVCSGSRLEHNIPIIYKFFIIRK